ncbi:acyltransferase family protein [Sphingomonas jatrophae]|uniref:Peptidoglycan/LPS O-acetylase OafA/YrhL, contains acyltransferase and SGNH-hydrolase domains n=1 Tax=Sphingomonas jatrophae TaxID=1166337 RepID=A0A1I6L6I8_9SPHN|nr:acyltransferase family protein [Sphingomonas jatrophae]SFR99044.1 Peptidoglycan/LPS O-acetylase OafA/YrhL, contains acyltransferase and SGNH-hydrolase domains [Sphingomonas jatrophae]
MAMAAGAAATPAFRADIQALRGVAVLLVLLYHTGLGWAPQGYLGVDMFFVVSGFLITRIVARDVDAGRFTFRGFWFHRARRILPAAYATLLLTVVAAAFLLTTGQLVEFRDQVIGSVLFVANVTLWQQTGYFAREAWQTPLLHLWSLAIEEQYYLLLPLAVTLLRGRVRIIGIALATLGSLALCALLVQRNPAATFFLLPTRAWELGIGSLGAFAAGHPQARRLAGLLLWPALATLLVVPLIRSGLPHPGPAALAVCLATLAIILADSAALNRTPLLQPLVQVGDFSYSLYLVHWPIFAFARIMFMERELPTPVIALAVAASLGLGYALFRLVETPLRALPRAAAPRLAGGLVVAAAVLVAVPVGLVAVRGNADARLLVETEGFKGCLLRRGSGLATGCAQSPAPEILVWGDSYGGHIIPGLDATTTRPIEQQTRAMCGPLAGVTERGGLAERGKARSCLTWNNAALTAIGQRPSVQVVVLASRWDRFLNPEAALVSPKGALDVPADGRASAVRDAILTTATRLRALGKRVIVIAAPPTSRFDQGLCWERRHQNKPTLGPFADCRLRPDLRAPLEAPTNAMLAQVERAGTPVVFLERGMCPGGACVGTLDGRPLYRDAGHLTVPGSIFAGRANDLGRQVWERAR